MILNRVMVNGDDNFFSFECFEFSGTIFLSNGLIRDYVVYFDNWDVLTSLGDRVSMPNIKKYLDEFSDVESRQRIVFFESMDLACDCIFNFASSNFSAKTSIANALEKSKSNG